MKQEPLGTLPRIVNIANVRATTRRPTLLHFTKEQWQGMVKDLPALPQVVPDRQTFLAFSIPGVDGMIGSGRCPIDCEEIPIYKPVKSFDGWQIVDVVCQCPENVVKRGYCHLAFRVRKQGLLKTPELVCIGADGKLCRDERPGMLLQANGSIVLGCLPR